MGDISTTILSKLNKLKPYLEHDLLSAEGFFFLTNQELCGLNTKFEWLSKNPVA